MSKSPVLLAVILGPLAVLAALAAAVGAETRRGAPEPVTFLGEAIAPERIARGAATYAANCAACHGANLEGQPDWRRRGENGRMPAPPHDVTGHSWHHSDRQLFTITKRGVGAVVPGYDSDMPAFEGVLSDAEVVEILAFIKSTWSGRERGFQAEVTANDRGGS